MELQVKDLDAIITEKGNKGIDEVSELLAKENTKVYNGEVEVKYILPEKYVEKEVAKVAKTISVEADTEIKNIKEIKMETKANKNLVFKALHDMGEFKLTRTDDLIRKAFPADATLQPMFSGAIVEITKDLTVSIYESELLKHVTKIELETPHYRIPQLVVTSGYAGRQVEGSGINIVKTSGSFTDVQVHAENAIFEVSDLTLQSVTTWSQNVLPKAGEQIATQIEGGLVGKVVGASGKVQIACSNASGMPELSDLANAYTHLFPRKGQKGLLVSPALFSQLLSFNNISGLRDIIRYDGNTLKYLDCVVVQTPMLPAPSGVVSGRMSGTYAFVNLGELFVAQLGQTTDLYNPFYAFDNGGSAIRVQAYLDWGVMSQVNYTISGVTYSDVVTNN